MKNQAVLDAVLDQIQLDVANGDYSAILEMIQHLPLEILQGYLPEVENLEIDLDGGLSAINEQDRDYLDSDAHLNQLD